MLDKLTQTSGFNSCRKDRSHSATQHVLVRLTATDSHWQVTIEDDGRVFKDPLVIRERVRLIEGKLKVESSSRGSRLVVTVPQRQS